LLQHFFRLLWALVFIFPLALQAGAEHWPSAGEIKYDVMRGENGMKLGEGRHGWEHDGSRYRMQTKLETTGLVGLLYSFNYVQTSEGEVADNGLRPVYFSVERSDRDTESATFDWDDKSVLIERRRDRKDTHDIASGDQDVLSVWHLVGLRNGADLPEKLSLVTNRRVSDATLEVIGTESVRLPMGTVEALRVRAKATSGQLTIDMWLSKDHHLLPVRLLIEDDEGEVLDQQAVSVKIED